MSFAGYGPNFRDFLSIREAFACGDDEIRGPLT